MKQIIATILFLSLVASGFGQSRIKDIADVQGMTDIPVLGYGLVVGLDGTGDSPRALFTNQALKNMLDRFGITIASDRVRVRNVAGVMITASIPAFAKPGQKVDVLVSSIGDSKSLSSGTLLLTPVAGADQLVYGLAQGPVSIGGFSIESEGVRISQNANSVATIPGGLIVDKDVSYSLEDIESIRWTLRAADVTTATRMAQSINATLGEQLAIAIDPTTVEVAVNPGFDGGAMGLIALTEQLTVLPDVAARVVINERTGTVVVGVDVQLSTVAISHGSLSISITSTPTVSQPNAFSQGQTVAQPVSQIQVEQEGGGMMVIEKSASVGDIATALNNLGVSPRDIISIFQALKRAGALQGELVII